MISKRFLIEKIYHIKFCRLYMISEASPIENDLLIQTLLTVHLALLEYLVV